MSRIGSHRHQRFSRSECCLKQLKSKSTISATSRLLPTPLRRIAPTGTLTAPAEQAEVTRGTASFSWQAHKATTPSFLDDKEPGSNLFYRPFLATSTRKSTSQSTMLVMSSMPAMMFVTASSDNAMNAMSRRPFTDSSMTMSSATPLTSSYQSPSVIPAIPSCPLLVIPKGPAPSQQDFGPFNGRQVSRSRGLNLTMAR